MEVQFLFWTDYLLLPVYLVLATVLLNRYFRKRHGYNPALKKHFNRGIILKLVGCIAIALIYQFYYGGAYDGISYFEGAKMLNKYWSDNPQDFLHSLFSNLENFNDNNLAGIRASSAGIFADQSFVVSKIAAVFNIFSFNSFLPCSIFFCVFAYLGLWNFFIFLREEFGLTPTLAGFCTIYIPSVLIWDSGIFKDTITFTALLWLFMCGYYGLVKRRKVIKNLVGLALAGLLISFVKVYILAAFVPFFILYVFNMYKSGIKNPTVRVLATPFVIGVSAACVFFFLQNADELLGRYSVDQILDTASKTSYFIQSIGEAGSAYTLDVDYSSPFGLVKAVPMGINISLFRPYPWEYAKPFILFASAESMIFLYYTLYIFFKGGFGRTIKIIFRSPIMQFCLLFSLLFAFMVGISSSNFGSLVRYKIPFMPFYLLFLCLLYKEKFGFSKTVSAVQQRRMANRPAWAKG